MTIRNLERAVHPKSVAVIGASTREGSLGQVVMNNIIAAGFEGEVWPVNPKHRDVAGRRCSSNACELPGVPDLGVIVTPPTAVPSVIGQRSRSRDLSAGSKGRPQSVD